MEFLKKYFYGQLTPQEETRVQDWLAEHFDEPQVQEMLETLMSEMEAEDREMSSAAFDEVSAKLGLDRKNRRRGRPHRRKGRCSAGERRRGTGGCR